LSLPLFWLSFSAQARGVVAFELNPHTDFYYWLTTCAVGSENEGSAGHVAPLRFNSVGPKRMVEGSEVETAPFAVRPLPAGKRE
jgi:hypothetical protein